MTTTMTESSPLMRVDHAGFMYPDGLQAVGDVSMEVKRGEIVSVIGPSGCGKSTLLRMLAYLRNPTSGHVHRSDVESGRLPCSMVFQEETLLPWLKVRDNIALAFRFEHNKSKSKKEVEEHVRRLLEMVGLDGYGNVYPAKLSGGMKRRVAVLTAIAPLPSILLMDEPFSALDEPTRIGVHGDIYGLLRQFDISGVLVTHDLAEAITLSDRVLLLSRAPSRIVEEYHVPFPLERDVMDLRGTPEFLDLYGRIWSDLEVQIKASRQ